MRRGLGQQGTLFEQEFRRLDLLVRLHRADGDAAAGLANGIQVRDPRDVDHDLRAREAQLHRGDQAVAAREHLGVVAVTHEQRQRFIDRRGADVVEICGIHIVPGPAEAGRHIMLLPPRARSLDRLPRTLRRHR
jgi:hypothetical protein